MKRQVPPPFVSSTPVMLVELECAQGEWPKARGFTASFAGTPVRAQFLPLATFHHLAWTLSSSDVATLFINGTQQHAQTIERSKQPWRQPLTGGNFATALGRGAPAWQNGGDFGYACLALDEVRLWAGVRSQVDIQTSILEPCPELVLDPSAALLACYNFDELKSSEAGVHFPDNSNNSIPVFIAEHGFKFQPSCVNIDDGGSMALDHNQAGYSYDTGNAIDWSRTNMWGYCTKKARLPGAGFDYSEAELEMAAAHRSAGTAAVLVHYPGCGSVPIRLENNSAKQFGGGIYYDSCQRLDKICFLQGIGPLSGSSAILMRNNRAQTGGAVFVDCMHVGIDCVNVFGANNTIGALPAVPKLEMTGSLSFKYGDWIATQPASIEWYPKSPHASVLVPSKSGSQYIQSQSVLALEIDVARQVIFGLLPYDSFGSVARGIGDVVEVRVCAAEGECSKSTALMPVAFVPLDDQSGASSWSLKLECAIGAEAVALEVALLRYESVLPLRAIIQCGRCRSGESRTVDTIRGTWFCQPCGADQYVSDPNNIAHSCQDCPIGGSCHEGSFKPQPGSRWVIESTGVYKIVSCPAGFSIVASPYLKQHCQPCDAGSYCPGGSSPELTCMLNTFSKPMSRSKDDCVQSEFVGLVVNLLVSQSEFTEQKQMAYRKSIAAAAGTNASYVEITSFAEASTRRSSRALLAASIDIQTRIAGLEQDARTLLEALDEKTIKAKLAENGLPLGEVRDIAKVSDGTESKSKWNTLYLIPLGAGLMLMAMIGFMLWTRRPAERSEEMKRAEARKRVQIRKREFAQRQQLQEDRDARAESRKNKRSAALAAIAPQNVSVSIAERPAEPFTHVLGEQFGGTQRPSHDDGMPPLIDVTSDYLDMPPLVDDVVMDRDHRDMPPLLDHVVVDRNEGVSSIYPEPEESLTTQVSGGNEIIEPGQTILHQPSAATCPANPEWGKFETQKITLGKAYQSVLTTFIGFNEKQHSHGLANPMDAIEKEFYPFGFFSLQDEPSDNFDHQYHHEKQKVCKMQLNGEIDDDEYESELERLEDEFQDRKHKWWIAGANFDYVRYGEVGDSEHPDENFWLPPQVLHSFQTGQYHGGPIEAVDYDTGHYDVAGVVLELDIHFKDTGAEDSKGHEDDERKDFKRKLAQDLSNLSRANHTSILPDNFAIVQILVHPGDEAKTTVHVNVQESLTGGLGPNECWQIVHELCNLSEDRHPMLSHGLITRHVVANGVSLLKQRSRLRMTLKDFSSHGISVIAGLEDHHVLTLRLYTSDSYHLFNNPMREQIRPHPLMFTVYFLDQALKMLTTVEAKLHPAEYNKIKYLWRGMKNRELDADLFFAEGGTELAPMSTTDNLEVALHYSRSDVPLIYRYEARGRSRGVDIGFLSMYPKEKEFLYAPLTGLILLKMHQVSESELRRMPLGEQPENVFSRAEEQEMLIQELQHNRLLLTCDGETRNGIITDELRRIEGRLGQIAVGRSGDGPDEKTFFVYEIRPAR